MVDLFFMWDNEDGLLAHGLTTVELEWRIRPIF